MVGGEGLDERTGVTIRPLVQHVGGLKLYANGVHSEVALVEAQTGERLLIVRPVLLDLHPHLQKYFTLKLPFHIETRLPADFLETLAAVADIGLIAAQHTPVE